MPSGKVACRDGLVEFRRLESQAVDGFLPTFQTRQVSADESGGEDVAQGRQNIRGGGPGQVTGKGNQRAELVPGVVLEHSGCGTDQSLPKKLQNVIFLDVFAQAEDLQIAEERFSITGNLTFLSVSFDDEVEPTPFEVKFSIRQRQLVNLGDIQAEEAQGHVKGRAIGEGIKRHFEIQLGVVHSKGSGLDRRYERIGIIVDITQIIYGGLNLREVDR